MNSSELIDRYLAGAESVGQAVEGLNRAQLVTRPTDGSWCILEIACHIADSEALFAERIKRVLSEDRPLMLFADPNKHAAALAYLERDVEEETNAIRAIRRQIARILRAQPSEAWNRIGIHSKEGERSVEQIVRKSIDHLEHHLRFLHAKRSALESV